MYVSHRIKPPPPKNGDSPNLSRKMEFGQAMATAEKNYGG